MDFFFLLIIFQLNVNLTSVQRRFFFPQYLFSQKSTTITCAFRISQCNPSLVNRQWEMKKCVSFFFINCLASILARQNGIENLNGIKIKIATCYLHSCISSHWELNAFAISHWLFALHLLQPSNSYNEKRKKKTAKYAHGATFKKKSQILKNSHWRPKSRTSLVVCLTWKSENSIKWHQSGSVWPFLQSQRIKMHCKCPIHQTRIIRNS